MRNSVGAATIISNPTDRQNAEAREAELRREVDRLRRSEDRFRLFADHSAEVIWILNVADDRLEYLSPGYQRVWGVAPEAALADPGVWRSSIHPDDRGGVARALDRLASTGETVTREYRIVRPDGAVRWIRDTVFAIRWADGRLIEAGGIAKDVTRAALPTAYLIGPDCEQREACAAILRAAGQRVTVFTSEDAFLDVAGVLTPGCVVVRPAASSADPFRLARLLKARRIRMPVIVETVLGGDVALAIKGMKAGAADILEAPAAPEVLTAAVSAALAGMREAAEEDRTAEAARVQIAMMSEREREVLEGLLAGGTNKTIARELGISPRTVESHRARLMERLGAHTLPEAVLAATSAGLKPSRRPVRPEAE